LPILGYWCVGAQFHGFGGMLWPVQGVFLSVEGMFRQFKRFFVISSPITPQKIFKTAFFA
jgi:hypothetical protein